VHAPLTTNTPLKRVYPFDHGKDSGCDPPSPMTRAAREPRWRGLKDVIDAVRTAAASKTYRNNRVLVMMKVLDAAGLLRDTDTSAVDAD
jgi:hypothetical protein